MTVLYDLSVFLTIVPLSIAIMLFVYWFWRLIRGALPVEDVKWAYELKKLKQEIEKRGIDFDQMMKEYYEMVTISYKRRGTLNKIDARIEGEFEEETVKKTKRG